MNKIDSILGKVFLYGLPVVIILAILSNFYKLSGLSGILFAAWMTLPIYLSIRLIISEPFRDKVLANLTFIKERDEREILLTGKAAKTTFLMSIAVLLLFFCLSCFQVSIYKVSLEKAVNGRTRVLTLGFNFSLIANPAENKPSIAMQKNIFSYRGLPMSGTAIILIMVIWQIISYNYSMRCLMKTGYKNTGE